MPTCKGMVSGTEVSVLRDTGCSKAVVRSELVTPEQFTDGHFPLALVYVDTPYYTGQVEALCMENPVYDLIIGNIDGARGPSEPDAHWSPSKPVDGSSVHNVSGAVETRAAAKKRNQPTKPLHVSSPIADVSRAEFIKAQHVDPSLDHLWDRAKQEQEGKYKYNIKNQILVRENTNPEVKGKVHSKVIVPTK